MGVGVNRIEWGKNRRLLRRSGIAVAGGAVVLSGLVMIALPAPGSLVILIGLTILAREFSWPRRLLAYLPHVGRRLVTRARALVFLPGPPVVVALIHSPIRRAGLH